MKLLDCNFISGFNIIPLKLIQMDQFEQNLRTYLAKEEALLASPETSDEDKRDCEIVIARYKYHLSKLL
jgi:hypothetical protein